MNYTAAGGTRTGQVTIPASKSWAHRMLICASLADKKTLIGCEGMSKDIEATINCLNGMGKKITVSGDKIELDIPEKACAEETEYRDLYCKESGSTLRFLVPVVGALGLKAVFHMEGKLPSRPMDALVKVLCEHGMSIHQENELLYCSGQLSGGEYSIPGNISSQYISGLLMALPLLKRDSRLTITETIESADYITMTEDCLKQTGISFDRTDNVYLIPGNQTYNCSETMKVECDWSGAAFFLCMGAFSKKGITLNGMNVNSSQGDKEILQVLKNFGADVTVTEDKITVKRGKLIGQKIDGSAIPDLIPVISVVAAGAQGETVVYNAARLRIKESDRLMTTANMLSRIGADIKETEDGLIISGKNELAGGTVESINDHRIAMSAAVAASICRSEVVIEGAECSSKSYPAFWEHLDAMEVEK